MALEEERPPSVLVVLSGAERWTRADGMANATGLLVEELIEPIRVFRDAGIDVTVATPGGVAATVGEASLAPERTGGEERGSELRDELDGVLADPVALEDVSPSDYDGVFVPGQNPASSINVARKTADRVRARAHFLHVVPHHGAWTFKHEQREAQGTFPTQKEAERAALEHARAHGDWEVIIHDRRGRIRDSEAVRPSS